MKVYFDEDGWKKCLDAMGIIDKVFCIKFWLFFARVLATTAKSFFNKLIFRIEIFEYEDFLRFRIPVNKIPMHQNFYDF